MNNIKIENDNKSNTIIKLQVDNSKINHAALNRLICELEDLGKKYSVIFTKGDTYGR